jgi:diphthine synthase
MLYLIGLGLYDEGDVTLNGVDAAKACDAAYAELYTSPWQGSLDKLEKLIGKRIGHLQRADLEEKSGKLIDEAAKKDVAVFVSGDPLVATTHSSLIIDARKRGIGVKIIHSSSVFSGMAETGLQIYKFGKTATIAYPEKNFFPKTPYKVLSDNKRSGLHTLLLLDVKADKGKYMTVGEGIDIMLEIEKHEKLKAFTEDTFCVGAARLGGDTVIKCGKASELRTKDFGMPPHILIVPGELHFSEEDFLRTL